MNRSPLVGDMVLARAAADPTAIAVVTDTGTVSYAELVRRAGQIADRIRRAGIGRNELVGLAEPRGTGGLIALLGILLSGAAYVYLDPTWPAQRRAHVARECRLRLVLGENPTGSADPGGPVGPREPVEPSDLCYVVYTSGSTGVPKGVAIEHGGVANMVRELSRQFEVTPGSRMLQFAAWSWDAAVCEILVALTAGATLVLAPEPVRQGGEILAGFMRRHRVGVATLTPSLLAALPHDALPDLVTIVAVGEACPPDLVRRWGADRRLFNGYGPTEATVAVAVGRCWPDEPVTIGRPLPGVLVRVVDDAATTVAPMDAGELLVGGAGLARGYLDGYDDRSDDPRPGVTSGGRFIIDLDGIRWYRTGDVVRQDRDGVLHYLGRLDDQVQVHGHRVELGEIAAAIQRQPQVRAATVTVLGGRLVAYVLAASPDLRPAQVRERAADWLPAYLLPEVRLVDRLPLTAHGKLDRAALMSPLPVPGAAAVPAAPPPARTSDAVSRVLDRIRFVLETDDVGPHDDFFDVGGHSLLAAQLAVDVTDQFGVPVTAAEVSTHRTAVRLADLLEPAPVERSSPGGTAGQPQPAAPVALVGPRA
jgi:amino acid adenylation domain-containing protein